jgi:hypothetical protein
MRNISPFLRNLAILAVIALLIVILNYQTALATAATLLRIAFIIAIAVVAYFFWRDIGRREIATWPPRAAWVLYGAVGLLVADIGWFMLGHPHGRDALAAVIVVVVCAYAGIRTWREQKSYL